MICTFRASQPRRYSVPDEPAGIDAEPQPHDAKTPPLSVRLFTPEDTVVPSGSNVSVQESPAGDPSASG